jgi:hypothetical protein
MSILASADDAMATRIVAESVARGAERMGASHRKGLSYMVDVTDGSDLAPMYKEARNALRHQADIEKAVVQSAAALFADPDRAKKNLSKLEILVDGRSAALTNEVKALYQLEADRWNVQASEPTITELEKEAAKIFPERVSSQQRGSGGGVGFDQLTEAERAALGNVPGHMRSELYILMSRNKSVLEIRDFLSGEFEPLPLPDLMEYFKVMEKLGRMKLTTK